MIRRYKYLLLAMLIAFVSHVIASDKALVNVYKKAQQPKQQFGYHQTTNKTPWESIIKAYEQADLATPPEKDAWLFIGSSSINRWHNLKSDFPEQEIIKRGFGGANLSQLYHYRNRILVNYKPKKIIIYTGNIDLKKDSQSQRNYMNDFVRLHKYIHQHCPNSQIYMISLKPSPMRMSEWTQAEMANKAVKDHCKTIDYLHFVDVSSQMLKNGKLTEGIFDQDQIHLNEAGYKVLIKVLKSVLTTSHKHIN